MHTPARLSGTRSVERVPATALVSFREFAAPAPLEAALAPPPPPPPLPLTLTLPQNEPKPLPPLPPPRYNPVMHQHRIGTSTGHQQASCHWQRHGVGDDGGCVAAA